ncbi:MAG: NAD(P)-dependent alcohol dehydrogenase [Phycisphaerales bacterium]|nr:NAD(P)-dependent alcohol dehydrogenase [Phycisphaerales bacterium]
MRAYQFDTFELTALRPVELPTPEPGPGEIRLRILARSLNYRDLLIIRGHYNPRLALPAIPLSDAAGVIDALGPGVDRLRVGDSVTTHFVAGWQDGEMRAEHLRTTLGTPGPGMAAESVVLPASAVLPTPAGWSAAEAATLPIAGLTAWSALVTVGNVQPGQTVLTLGTGGVSIFALQIAVARGARVIITSSSDEKLRRCRELGAWETVNYRSTPAWERRVLELTAKSGVDLVVENVGAATLNQSVACTRTGGTVALLGAIAGMRAELDTGQVLMRRVRICGVMVDSMAAFHGLRAFVTERRIRPVIDRTFAFDALPDALGYMESGAHLGKIVVE